jgi:molybdopterin-containing oxidoreductase family iron-sulfur binding subunit
MHSCSFAINQALASEAFLLRADKYRKGSNEKLLLIADMKRKVHTLIMSGVNPVYTLADSASFVEGLKKASVSLSLKKMKLLY